jgi:hypothetical protein
MNNAQSQYPRSPGSGRNSRRRGSIYLAVLGVSLITVTLGMGAVLAGRATMRSMTATNDVAEARLAAQSGLELARYWISHDSTWRTDYSSGAFATNLSLGRSTVTITATDLVDGNIANAPMDPLVITATGKRGQAVYKLRVTLTASAVPLPALAYAVHTGGQLHINGGRIRMGSATLSTNGALYNQGTIEGNASVASVSAIGTIWGSLANSVAAKAMPDSTTILNMYAAMGTQISTDDIDKQLLTPTVNPWGTPNAKGVYVIRSSNDEKLRDTRICGTLVVFLSPGRVLEVDKSLFLQAAQSDFPALIVSGDIVIECDSTQLSESDTGMNFNPAAMPYNGISDSDQSDVYPCEIQGLVHATGTVYMTDDLTVRGAIIAGSTATSNAFEADGSPEIVYTPSLFTSPPQGYTSQVKMVVQPGSMVQVVD